ncbi:MAG: hypothetical protein ABIF11_07010, partial [Nitrospirota bacterium]
TQWKAMQEKGKANVYEESYNEKIQGLGQLQSAFGIDQKIIDKLMTHVERTGEKADYYRKQQEPTIEIEKLLKRIDELPPGSPKKDILTARLEKLTQKTGEKIEIDATTGKVTITRGELGKDEPTRPTPKIKSDIQSALLASQDSMARLKRMETTFNRDYLNIGKRIGFAVTGWQEKLEGTPLESILGKAKPKDVKEATKYWVWRQDSVTNLNKEIKWLTGAAMNKEEVPRLQQEVPNPGLGIFDGDSPSQFDSKLKNKISQTKLYIARYNMYLKQGVTPDKIKEMGDKGMLMSETQIKQKINEKAKILEKSGLSKDEIINQLEKEFFIIKAK